MTAFEALGGEPRVRALVDRFYDLMALEPGNVPLRELHPSVLEGSRDKLFWYLCGWLGGPQHYVQRFGHPRLRARHLPFSAGLGACRALIRHQFALPGRNSTSRAPLPPSAARACVKAITSSRCMSQPLTLPFNTLWRPGEPLPLP